MQVEALSALQKLGQTSGNQTKETSNSFSNILSDALKNAEETDLSNAQDTLSVLAGEDTELHTSMIEIQKAELSLNLAIQVRNKVVEAYNEIMRMQV